MPAVSVVIPVYNTAQYIGRCLDSVRKQTFKDLEILCIDDGSTDGTPDILRHHAEEDGRIRIITLPENHGVPYARNLAIDEARGEYLYYMDSDDWLDLDYLEKMYHHAVASGQDIVINSNWLFDYGNSVKKSADIYPQFDVKEPTYFSTVLIQTSFFPVVWARLYRLGYLRENNIRSPQVEGGVDDNCFTSLAEVLQPERYVFAGPYYHYFQRPGSLSRQKNLALNYTRAFEALLNELRERNIAPKAAKRFYVIPQLTIIDEITFNAMRSYFSEVESDMFESLGLYMYQDFRSLEVVLDCPDYKTFLSRYPSGFALRSDVVWEIGRMTGIMGRIPSSKLERLSARELLSPLRFDIFSILLYIKNKESMPRFGKRLFREIDRSYVNKSARHGLRRGKRALDRDAAEFENLLENMRGTSPKDYRVPVGEWPVPLDGSHIVAAASYYGREVSVFKLASADKAQNDYSRCYVNGMTRLVQDLSAREGIEWIKNPKIICFWSRGKSDDHYSGYGILYSREFNLGPASYSKLRGRLSPGPVNKKGRTRVRFVFCSGSGQVAEKVDCQVIEDALEVKRVSDLLLTWKGRREWYLGGGLMCRLAEPLENLFDHVSTETRWTIILVKHLLSVIRKKAKGKFRFITKIINFA